MTRSRRVLPGTPEGDALLARLEEVQPLDLAHHRLRVLRDPATGERWEEVPYETSAGMCLEYRLLPGPPG